MCLEVSDPKSRILVVKASRRTKLAYTHVEGIPVVPLVKYLGIEVDETLDHFLVCRFCGLRPILFRGGLRETLMF